MKLLCLRILALACVLTGCSTPNSTPQSTPDSAVTPPTASAPVSFKTRVAPILKNSCSGCHSAESAMGGMTLFDAAGEVSHSQVKTALNNIIKQVETGRMPRGGKPRLTTEEVAALKQWQAGGATDN